MTLAAAVVVIVGAQPTLLSHGDGPRFPRRFRRSGDGAADGHRQPAAVRRRHGPRARRLRRSPALFLGMRANFDPSIGPARLIFAFEAVIIGGLGSLWGTLAGGVDPRRCADRRRRRSARNGRSSPAISCSSPSLSPSRAGCSRAAQVEGRRPTSRRRDFRSETGDADVGGDRPLRRCSSSRRWPRRRSSSAARRCRTCSSC